MSLYTIKNIHSKIRKQGTFVCHFCEQEVLAKKLTIDHIVPKANGGTNRKTNLVMACYLCNSAKGCCSNEYFTAWLNCSPEGLRWKHSTKKTKVPTKGWNHRFDKWINQMYFGSVGSGV